MNEHTLRARELLASADATLADSAEAIERLKDKPWNQWEADQPRFSRCAQRQFDRQNAEQEERLRIASAPLSVAKRAAADWHSLGDGYFEKQIDMPASDRLIHGVASSSAINEHKYSLIAGGMTATLPVPILSNHTGRECPIGEVFYVRRSGTKVYVRAALFDNDAADYAWSLIQCGDLRCFSGAAARDGLKIQGVVDGKTFYDEWRLREVSICRKGANPDSIFEIWDGADDGAKFFTTATVTPIRGADAA